MRRLRSTLKLEARDREGRLLWTHEQKLRSYVTAWWGIIGAHLGAYAATPYQVRDTSNVLRTLMAHLNNLNTNAAAATATYGIVVGTGTGAVAPTNYALGTQIAHGVGPGQLSYGACATGAPFETATQCGITVTRAFTNATANPITINEAGIYSRGVDSGASLRNFCIVRDLVVPGRVVGAGITVTATYTLIATS